MTIYVSDISKRFGKFQALDSVSLSIAKGEMITLLGPSGSGKTTLLRLIAGLDEPDSGDIRFDGQSVVGIGARHRAVGFVFQHYALFRHLTVFENIAFGLRVRPKAQRLESREIRSRVDELLDLVQVDWLTERYPHQLSGGQRQRVALARALAIEPKVLLLDEPFGALDAKVRKELRRWLKRLHERTNMTSILVTHDQEEALEIADRVVVMSEGRIEQIGGPEEVYENPKSAFVLEFLGTVNRFRNGQPANADDAPTDEIMLARPHEIGIEAEANGPSVIRFIAPIGPTVRLEVETPSITDLIEIELPRPQFKRLGLKAGDRVRVTPLKVHRFR
ncbi:MAG: sulfate ABC transporter ATP-binding protein [Alphaproteobacteria bacterium]|nr:sulfate ABC transporter ATP-binding protein [Alphaproteobacteria bacterium]